jgi:catechol 2,3-dioxygenase-like lactoylglutathione lyase family enzyme
MVTFSNLLHADLGKLQAAADEWKLLPKKYQGLQELFEARVTKPLKSDWHGNAADQAQTSLAKIKKQYGAAAEEAQAIATLLLDVHAEFSTAQKKLRRIIDEEAPAEKLEVLDGGMVIDADLDNQGSTDAYRDTFLPERKAEIEAMQRRIEKVLRDATAADEAADWALRQDSNGKNSDSFNKNIYTSLDAARGAQKDTAEALRLANKGGENLSNEELDRLGSILAKRKNDMIFAEKFATGMGPKGVLEFWREASGPNSGERGSERNAALKQLQAGLGSTLGIATQSDSAAMDGWKEKMLALGPQTIDPGDSGGPSAKGYQLMSSLMRSGAYDTDFLNDYGRDLVRYEKSRSPATSREVWAPDSTMPRIDYSGDGPGADPMTGYMDALSKNPEAATQFLDPGEPRENGHLTYLVDDREWVKDGFHEKTGQGSLALAVEAGATGHQPGHEDAVRDHTAAQARIMRDSINMLDGGPKNETLPEGMHRPIAHALGDYVSDTHHILSSVNDGSYGHSGENASGVWTDKETGQMRMAVDRGSLIRVMRGVSDDPEAYHTIQEAETAHVAKQLADMPHDMDEEKVKGVMSNCAKGMGAIDAIQGDVILDRSAGEKSEHKWWIGKAGYHPAASAAVGASIVTKFPMTGDLAVRLIDVGATAWQQNMDSATDAAAAEDIEKNVVGSVDKGGQAAVNAMVAEWYEQRGRDADAPDVDFAQNGMQTIYQNGRTNAQSALGRGGDNS